MSADSYTSEVPISSDSADCHLYLRRSAQAVRCAAHKYILLQLRRGSFLGEVAFLDEITFCSGLALSEAGLKNLTISAMGSPLEAVVERPGSMPAVGTSKNPSLRLRTATLTILLY